MTIVSARPTRRTLVRGAAWSVPAVSIAAAAPAFAASPCDALTGKTLDWDGPNVTFSRAADRLSASAVYDPDLAGPIPAMTVTLAASYEGNMKPGTESGFGTALTVTSSVGGLGVSALALVQATTSRTPQSRADRGTYTFSFTRPVSNLEFTLTDIDSANGDFRDVMEPSAGYAYSGMGSAVTTDTGGPNGLRRFYSSTTDGALNDTTSGNGNVTLKYAGPISSFSITYWNAQSSFTTDTNQGVFITDMKFDYKPC